MSADQLAKGVLVVVNKNSSDEVRIGQLHMRRLSGGGGGGTSFFPSSFQTIR